MAKKNMRRIHIHWDNPISSEKVLTLTDDLNDCGIYQIYGHHLVFGSNALLYIGMARDQTFAQRFSQHKKEWLDEENDIFVRVGRIAKEDYEDEPQWRDWKKLVTDAEALLINWHTPPYNSRSINEYEGQALYIQNWGNRGSLLPECSSDWNPRRPDDTNKIA